MSARYTWELECANCIFILRNGEQIAQIVEDNDEISDQAQDDAQLIVQLLNAHDKGTG